jgi:zinc/manganese transport system ATP-binding protein
MTAARAVVSAPILDIRGATLHRDGQELWTGLDLRVEAGEFLAVLGQSGSGKTTLLQTILGLQKLSSGEIRVAGESVRRGNPAIGYIPQQRPFGPGTSLRGIDVVALGLQGPRWGFPIPRSGDAERIKAVTSEIGASAFAHRPVGVLSGGEQQRLRVGQALVDSPKLLLCDEPLSNLDLANQMAIADIIDRQRRQRDAAVILVTHDINPIMGKADRILYLAGGRFALGTPSEVLKTDVLSELYGAPVHVLQAGERLVVVGAPDHNHHHHHGEGEE